MKVKRRHFVIALIVLCFSVIFICSCNNSVRHNSLKVKVMLMENEGLEIDGSSVVEVVSGKSAEFTVSLKEGYVYMGNSAGAYYNTKTGKLTLSNVKYPTSIEIQLLNTNNMLSVDIESLAPKYVYSDAEYENWYNVGDTVTVYAMDTAGYSFIGWSFGAYHVDGGEIVSTELSYSYELKADTPKIYANYKQAEQYVIIYHANGGIVKESGAEIMSVSTKRESQFACRNTIHSNDTFVRDGYIAVGYSTEPVVFEDYDSVNDIPGFSNMGGICVVPEDTCQLDLYVVWAKVTNSGEFVLSKSDGNITIKSYKGKSSVVVIPENIGGYNVTRIAANAFSNTLIKNVVIPDTVTTIEKNAFYYCTQMKQVVFFDSVTSVENDSFYFCKKISTIVLNSQRLPVYAGSSEGSFCLKYERVITAPEKMLVVVSGSSTLNGMMSEEFQKAYPDYTIINYGTNAGTPSYFYLKVISNYVGEGDIIIHAGEYGSTTMGSNKIEWKLFRGNEQAYDIFREVDMTEFTNFWGAYQEFQNDRGTNAGKAYQTVCSALNEYGDLVNDRYVNKGFAASGVYSFYSCSNYMSAENAKRMNSVNSIIVSKGGVLLCSFATLDIDAVAENCRNNQDAYDTGTEYFRSVLDYPVISNVGTYVMEHSYFYDSIWHCTYAGAEIRTANLLSDLEQYFNDPSNY